MTRFRVIEYPCGITSTFDVVDFGQRTPKVIARCVAELSHDTADLIAGNFNALADRNELPASFEPAYAPSDEPW